VWTMLLMLLKWPGLCYRYASRALCLLLWPALYLWFFYDLNYVFAYACFCDTSMGHYTWYLVTWNGLSLGRREADVGADDQVATVLSGYRDLACEMCRLRCSDP
jgi:hypothetical protein